jgi:hypothetical protein
MSTEMPAALAGEAAEFEDEAEPATNEWIEPALAALFTAAAVLFACVLAVMTGLG